MSKIRLLILYSESYTIIGHFCPKPFGLFIFLSFLLTYEKTKTTQKISFSFQNSLENSYFSINIFSYVTSTFLLLPFLFSKQKEILWWKNFHMYMPTYNTPSKNNLFRKSNACANGLHHENSCIKSSSQLQGEHCKH